MDVYFVQPGSINDIVHRAYLGIETAGSFDYWAPFIKPWPGSLSAAQVITK